MHTFRTSAGWESKRQPDVSVKMMHCVIQCLVAVTFCYYYVEKELRAQRHVCEGASTRTLASANELVAVSKGTQPVKTLLQQNPPILSCWYWPTQVDLCNGCKMVLCVYYCIDSRQIWVIVSEKAASYVPSLMIAVVAEESMSLADVFSWMGSVL